jgi:uncharacterized damage-inducible protein DinB
VDHVLSSWKGIRADTIAAVEEFPAGEFNFRPIAELAAFGEIAYHILMAGHGLTGLLLAGETDLTGPEFRERMKPHLCDVRQDAGAAELAAALGASIEQRTGELAAQPAEFWDQIVRRMDGQELTRLEMVQSIKEHELTHRQQLFTYLRLKGIVPATTRRRLARQAAK